MQSTIFVLTKPWPPPQEAGHGNEQAENSLLSLIPTTETDHSLSERNFCLDPVTSELGSTVPVLGRAAAHSTQRKLRMPSWHTLQFCYFFSALWWEKYPKILSRVCYYGHYFSLVMFQDSWLGQGLHCGKTHTHTHTKRIPKTSQYFATSLNRSYSEFPDLLWVLQIRPAYYIKTSQNCSKYDKPLLPFHSPRFCYFCSTAPQTLFCLCGPVAHPRCGK